MFATLKKHLSPCLLLSGALTAASLAAGDEALEPTFHASFDKSFVADAAKGDPRPLASEKVSLVPGLKGSALRVSEGGALKYLSAGNISGEAGTLSMWIKLDWTPGGLDLGSNRKMLFYAGAGSSCPRASTILNGVYFYSGLACGLAAPICGKVFPGVWQHVAFTWGDGSDKLYLNGLLVASEPDDGVRARAFKPGDELNIGGMKGRLSFEGEIDEVKIFAKPLPESAIRAVVAEFRSVAFAPVDFVAMAGSESVFRFRAANMSDGATTKNALVRVLDKSSGAVLTESVSSLKLPASGVVEGSFKFTPPASGEYLVEAGVDGAVQRRWEICALDSARISDSMPLSATGEVKLKLVEEIDCARVSQESKYRDDGACRVVDAPFGSYREGLGTGLNSGFAYRLKIDKPGVAHWIEFEHPDDATRTFLLAVYPRSEINGISAGGGTLDAIGVISGGERPLSRSMQTKRMLLWPDSKDLLLLCFSYPFSAFKFPNERGAALAKIRVYENEGPLPRLAVNEPEKPRAVGTWNEDPAMPSVNLFNRDECAKNCDFEFWRVKIDRMVRYMRFVGLSCWSIEAMDYIGDSTGSMEFLLQGSQVNNFPGWADLNAAVFEREGVPFYIELNHRLICQGSDRVPGALHALFGKESVPLDFDAAERMGEGNPMQMTARDELADIRAYSGGRCPVPNPLHPKSRAALLRMIELYCEHFGRWRKFQGIDLSTRCNANFPLTNEWFEADAGYEDFTMKLFESETGVRPPVDSKSRTRFSERAKWLKANAWDEWLSWRCRKVRDNYAELLAAVRKGDPSRSLVVRLIVPPDLNEPMLSAAKGLPPKSQAEFWRERGIDIKALSSMPGLILMPAVVPNARICPSQRVDERFWSFSPNLAGFFKDDPNPALSLYRHANMEISGAHGSAQRIKSFWWPIARRPDNFSFNPYAIEQPEDRYVLEHCAWALAEADPLTLWHGFWGCVENGAIAKHQEFYKAFRSIPATPFEKAPGVNDPVTLRIHGEWIYLVNKSPEPSGIEFKLDLAEAVDAVDGTKAFFETKDGSPLFKRELKGFETLVFKFKKPVAVKDVRQLVSAKTLAEAQAQLESCEACLAEAKGSSGFERAAVERILAEAKAALAAGEIVKAQCRLQSRELYKLKAAVKGAAGE